MTKTEKYYRDRMGFYYYHNYILYTTNINKFSNQYEYECLNILSNKKKYFRCCRLYNRIINNDMKIKYVILDKEKVYTVESRFYFREDGFNFWSNNSYELIWEKSLLDLCQEWIVINL